MARTSHIGNMLEGISKAIAFFLRPIFAVMNRPVRAGLCGWLIVFGTVLILWTLLICAAFVGNLIILFSNDHLKYFMDPEFKKYAPLAGPAMMVALILSGALVVATLYSVYLFFSKKKPFLKWSIGLAAFIFLFKLYDGVASRALIPGEWFKGVTIWELIWLLLKWFAACAIWVYYMRMSKRVKATFVK
jgi:hypothetical protein